MPPYRLRSLCALALVVGGHFGAVASTLVGPQKFVVIQVRFPDSPTSPRYQQSDLQGFFDNELNKLWSNISYNNISINATVTKLYSLDKNLTYYFPGKDADGNQEPGKWNEFLDAAVQQPVKDGVDFSGARAIIVVMVNRSDNCFYVDRSGVTHNYDCFDGSTWHYNLDLDIPQALDPLGLGRRAIKASVVAEFGVNAAEKDPQVWGRWAHEMGHTMQQNGPESPSSGHPSGYNSQFELMDRLYPGQVGMFEKQPQADFPGWMPPSQYVILKATGAGGGGTFTLASEEITPAAAVPVQQAIRAELSPNLYYLVSVRQRLNGDEIFPIPCSGSAQPLNCTEGVFIERVVVGTDPEVTVQGNGGDPNLLWQEGTTYSNASDSITISVVKKRADTLGRFAGYEINVTFGTGTFPDVMLRPWLSPPLNTYETTDIWIDSSCNGYGTFQYGTRIPDGDATPVGDGNGDNPCANHENRVYARVRNIGNATATNVQVHFEVTNPLGVGIIGSDPSGWSLIGSVTSADFPALASIPAGGSTDVWIPWTPQVPAEQLATGPFNFHSCVRVRINQVAGELNTANQDGDGEQENIAQFYSSASGGGPTLPIDPIIPIRNPSNTQPTSFSLFWEGDLPSDWTVQVNGGNTVVDLAPGEVRQIPVHIVPSGTTSVGGIHRLRIGAGSVHFLVNPSNPTDTHLDFEDLSAVTIEVRTATPSSISINARAGGAGLIVNGQLTPAPHPGLPILIDLLDASGNVLTSKLTQADAAGNYSTDLVRPGGVAFAAASFVGEAFQQGVYARVAVPILGPAVISKFFTPPAIALGGTSSVTFTVRNPNTTSSLSGINFIDTLPPGLAVAAVGELPACGGGAITATPGSSTVTLTGATLSPDNSCTFSVTVIGTSAGVKLNTTGRVGSVEGGTGGTASAGIAVGVSPGPAACGVNGFPDPLSLFRNWTYSMEGFAPSALPFTSAGQFAASIGGAGSQGGILKIANTSSQNGLITRQELDAGRYSIYPDCSGGTLTFNLSTRPLQFDFWFVGFDQIAFVSTTGGFTVHGTAVASATSCPANPLDILNGTWTFSTEGFSLSAQPFTSAGRFVASSSSRSGNQNGFLAITSTSSQNGLIVSQEADAGAYQIYPDCSGGTLTFNLSTRPLQFDFWFATEKEIRFVSTTGGATIRGAAAR